MSGQLHAVKHAIQYLRLKFLGTNTVQHLFSGGIFELELSKVCLIRYSILHNGSNSGFLSI